MCVFYHHHRRIDHRANGDGNAAQRHDVGADAISALVVHDDEGGEYAQRQRDNGHQSRAQVEQENQAHHRHHRKLLQQLETQVVDGPLNQTGAVVHRHNLDAFGQAGLQLLEFGFDSGDRLQRVFTRAHHDHTARGFTLAVQLTNAASHFGT